MQTHFEALDNICRDESMVSIIQSADFIEGVLVGVASVPEIPMPQHWMPLVFKVHGQLPSNAIADKIADTMMSVLRDILRLMRDERCVFPARFSLPVPSAQEASLSAWCSGLMFAHGQFENVWQHAWHKMEETTASTELDEAVKDLKHCLTLFGTFAQLRETRQQARQSANLELVDKLPQISLSLPNALDKYTGLAGALADFLPNQFETFSEKPPCK